MSLLAGCSGDTCRCTAGSVSISCGQVTCIGGTAQECVGGQLRLTGAFCQVPDGGTSGGGDGGACTPDCTNRSCGSDGCHGSCGTCDVGETCTTAGRCLCQPESDAGLCAAQQKSCGPLTAVDNCGNTRNVNCGTCAPSCTTAVVQGCAKASCATQLAATGSCSAGCGVFPDQSCIASHCTQAYQDLAVCLAGACAPCDLDGYCAVFCAASVMCGNVTSAADCENTCHYWDIVYPAACGAWAGCGDLYTCGKIAPNHCGAGEFACAGSMDCVPMAKRCDTTPDCPDGSDEAGGVCTQAACPAGQRRCGGACVACPAGAASFACEGAVCEVGSCATGAPHGAGCGTMTDTVVVSPSPVPLAVQAVALGSDDSRHIVYTRMNGFTPTELDYATTDNLGNWVSEAIPVPATVTSPQLVLDGQNRPIVLAFNNGAKDLWEARRDAGGWHADSITPSPAPMTTNYGAGWNAAGNELVVVVPSAKITLRRGAGAWATAAIPSGAAVTDQSVSNLVFDGSGAASFAQAGVLVSGVFVVGYSAQYCALAAGTCTQIFKASSPTILLPRLSVDGSGPHFATIGGANGPATIFDDAGSWTMTPTAGLAPQTQTNLDSYSGAISGDDADRPTVAFAESPNMLVARWTGSDWQFSQIAPLGSGWSFGVRYTGRGFDLASRGTHWLLAVPQQNNNSWQLHAYEVK